MREDRSKAMAIFGKHDYLLRFWNELTPEERQQLVDQFTLYNMHEIDKAFKESEIPMVVFLALQYNKGYFLRIS